MTKTLIKTTQDQIRGLSSIFLSEFKAEGDAQRLMEFERKLRLTAGVDEDLLEVVASDSLQWAGDLWAIRMLSRLIDAKQIIEIGSFRGGSMLWLALCFRPETITCIDPCDGSGDKAEHDLDAFWEKATLATERTGVIIDMIAKRSDDAAPEIPDESADFIYIDGWHSEAVVSADLRTYWEKLKPGGVLAGHDYSDREPEHAGVVNAVNFWEEEAEVALLYPSRIYFIRKPKV